MEEKLSSWTGPSSDSEQEKQDRTERMIREAIDAHRAFEDCALAVFAKGSYANNTNVRADSDVDIAVECTEAEYWEEAAGAARKLDQYAARKVDHLRDIHSTLVLSPGLFSQQPGGAIGRSSARARRLAADARLPLAAPPSHAIAFAFGRDDGGVVRQPIQ